MAETPRFKVERVTKSIGGNLGNELAAVLNRQTADWRLHSVVPDPSGVVVVWERAPKGAAVDG